MVKDLINQDPLMGSETGLCQVQRQSSAEAGVEKALQKSIYRSSMICVAYSIYVAILKLQDMEVAKEVEEDHYEFFRKVFC